MSSKKLWVLVLISPLVWIAASDATAATPDASIRQAPKPLSGKERQIGRYIPDLEFQSVDGKSHQLSEFSNRKGIVIAVTSTSCPLSKKYLPTLAQLAKKYGKADFAFILVNPTATDKPADVKAAAAQLGADGVYVHDQQGKFSGALGVTSTTDALLLDPARTVRYQGAVDDQYGFGYGLDAPRKSYLVSAIEEFSRGQQLAIVATEAPGCHLSLDAPAKSNSSVTYHNRISRIMQANCVECHRDGGVAPFALGSHADLVAHAGMIETVVAGGTMPPWFAVPVKGQTTSPWVNDCSLGERDKADLLAWLKNGKVEGDLKDAAMPSAFPDGWTIGRPDLVVKAPEPIEIQATGTMRYKNVMMETGLDEDKWVQGIEVRPSAPQVVHHILVFARLPADTLKGRANGLLSEINYWGIYVPGNSRRIYPAGLARKLPKGAQVRLQIHYTPNGKETEDQTQVGFLFADKEPEHEVKTASLVNAWFEIPPGAPDFQDTAKLKLPVDITVLGFLPHMHLRGKACSYEVVTADGQAEPLLDLPRYDFNWQLLYRYAEPRTFTRGTTLKFHAAFDNSEKNPANPDPTASVHWGDQTYNEMIVGYMEYYVPSSVSPDQLAQVESKYPGLVGGEDDMLFTALDTNDDGQMSRDELKKITENPRFRQGNPFMAVAMFAALDTNQDQFLTIDEFKKLREMLGNRRRNNRNNDSNNDNKNNEDKKQSDDKKQNDKN